MVNSLHPGFDAEFEIARLRKNGFAGGQPFSHNHHGNDGQVRMRCSGVVCAAEDRITFMARHRRNRDVDIALGVAQVIALLVLAGRFLHQVRQMLLRLGVILIGAIILVGVVAFGVFLIRRTEKKSPCDSTHFTNLEATIPPQSTRPEKKQQSTADLIEQLRAIDWFRFEKLVALVYRKLDYTVTRRGGPDGGIDLVLAGNGGLGERTLEVRLVNCSFDVPRQHG
jgi:hypothetical protein